MLVYVGPNHESISHNWSNVRGENFHTSICMCLIYNNLSFLMLVYYCVGNICNFCLIVVSKDNKTCKVNSDIVYCFDNDDTSCKGLELQNNCNHYLDSVNLSCNHYRCGVPLWLKNGWEYWFPHTMRGKQDWCCPYSPKRISSRLQVLPNEAWRNALSRCV